MNNLLGSPHAGPLLRMYNYLKCFLQTDCTVHGIKEPSKSHFSGTNEIDTTTFVEPLGFFNEIGVWFVVGARSKYTV